MVVLIWILRLVSVQCVQAFHFWLWWHSNGKVCMGIQQLMILKELQRFHSKSPVLFAVCRVWVLERSRDPGFPWRSEWVWQGLLQCVQKGKSWVKVFWCRLLTDSVVSFFSCGLFLFIQMLTPRWKKSVCSWSWTRGQLHRVTWEWGEDEEHIQTPSAGLWHPSFNHQLPYLVTL